MQTNMLASMQSIVAHTHTHMVKAQGAGSNITAHVISVLYGVVCVCACVISDQRASVCCCKYSVWELHRRSVSGAGGTVGVSACPSIRTGSNEFISVHRAANTTPRPGLHGAPLIFRPLRSCANSLQLAGRRADLQSEDRRFDPRLYSAMLMCPWARHSRHLRANVPPSCSTVCGC